MYHEIPLNLTSKHIERLARGHTIHLPHEKIGSGIPVVLRRQKHTRICRAHRNQKGCRLGLDSEELEMQGGAFWDTLKKIGSFIKDKVFTNPAYKQHIAPLIKQGLNTGVDVLSGLAGSKVPFLKPLLGDAGRAGINKLGEVSGAYGMPGRAKRGSGAILPMSQGAATFMEHGGPLNPLAPRSDFSAPDYNLPARTGRFVKGSQEAKEWSARMRAAKVAKHGQAFKAAGY